MKASKLIAVLSTVLLIGCQENSLAPESVATTESFSSSEVAAKRLDGAVHGGVGLTAELLGSNEVPGPGDADGSGTAVVTLNHGQQEVCHELSVADIDAATAAHIHSAPAGVNGPIVIFLTIPSSGSSAGCAEDVDRELIKSIIQSPEDYYVNVHNAAYPGGAVRGQLSR